MPGRSVQGRPAAEQTLVACPVPPAPGALGAVLHHHSIVASPNAITKNATSAAQKRAPRRGIVEELGSMSEVYLPRHGRTMRMMARASAASGGGRQRERDQGVVAAEPAAVAPAAMATYCRPSAPR